MVQQLDELLVDGLGLGADRLVELAVGREDAGLQDRHLVGGCGKDVGGRARGSRALRGK